MFFCSATGKADCSKAGIGPILRCSDGIGGLRGIEGHQNGIEVVTTQRLGHGPAVVVAGDANEARDFLVFQLLYGGKNAVGTADAIQVVEVAQAVDLDQVEIVRLEKLEAGFYGAQRAVAVSRINLGGEKDILPALLGKLAETLLAQPLQWPARVRAGGIEVIDSEIKGPLETAPAPHPRLEWNKIGCRNRSRCRRPFLQFSRDGVSAVTRLAVHLHPALFQRHLVP